MVVDYNVTGGPWWSRGGWWWSWWCGN